MVLPVIQDQTQILYVRLAMARVVVEVVVIQDPQEHHVQVERLLLVVVVLELVQVFFARLDLVVRNLRSPESDKTCSVCGYIYKDLELKEREWRCPECETLHDRDRNASYNILRVGASTLAVDNVRPACWRLSLIAESHEL
jgi:transposase